LTQSAFRSSMQSVFKRSRSCISVNTDIFSGYDKDDGRFSERTDLKIRLSADHHVISMRRSIHRGFTLTFTNQRYSDTMVEIQFDVL
jgi:hypothetical protein